METPVQFENEGATLRGILHAPGPVAGPAALVFLHGWTGSRMGPHRLFVEAARRFSAAGYPSLRFDFRGRGDSDGETAEARIAGMIRDTHAACEFLRREHGVTRFTFVGICSGCKVAIGAAAARTDVKALALWSAEPMGRLRTKGSQTHRSTSALRQYARKLLRAETWRKLLAGRVNVRAVGDAVRTRERASGDERVAEDAILDRFRRYRGRILFVYGSLDPETRDAAPGYAEFCRAAGIPHAQHRIEGANHSFYSLDWTAQLLALTESWLGSRETTP